MRVGGFTLGGCPTQRDEEIRDCFFVAAPACTSSPGTGFSPWLRTRQSPQMPACRRCCCTALSTAGRPVDRGGVSAFKWPRGASSTSGDGFPKTCRRRRHHCRFLLQSRVYSGCCARDPRDKFMVDLRVLPPTHTTNRRLGVATPCPSFFRGPVERIVSSSRWPLREHRGYSRVDAEVRTRLSRWLIGMSVLDDLRSAPPRTQCRPPHRRLPRLIVHGMTPRP